MTGLDIGQLSEWLRSFGWYGYAAGALLVALQSAFPVVPFVVLAGANVLLFGFWPGFAVNYVFACLGSIAVFTVVRKYGKVRIEARLEQYEYMGKLNKLLETNGLFYITASRLLPILPSTAISLAAAVTKVRARDFVLGTLIGKLPMIWVESLIGHDLLFFHQHKARLFVLLTVFAVLLIVGRGLKRRWFGKPGQAKAGGGQQ